MFFTGHSQEGEGNLQNGRLQIKYFHLGYIKNSNNSTIKNNPIF